MIAEPGLSNSSRDRSDPSRDRQGAVLSLRIPNVLPRQAIHRPSRPLAYVRGSVWVGILLISATTAGGQAPGDEYTKAPLVNPPSLLQPPPADRSLIADDGTLYLSLKANPNTLNPILMSSAPEDRVGELVFDPLFKIDHQLQWAVNDDMVDSFAFAPDHRSAVLKLKDGLTWHDGQPYTADDIVFSWQQIADERVPCPSARSGTDQISSCVASDPRTVRFEFKDALPTNKWNVMFGVIPKHIYEKDKDNDPTLTKSNYYVQANRKPIGNGPYRFVQWDADKVVLERWDSFHGPKPYFARVILRIVPNTATRLLLFETGQIQEFEMSPQQFVKETNDPRFAAAGVKGVAPQWKYQFIAFNMDGSNPFFTERTARRALCHAIDYDRLVRQAYDSVYPRSHGIHDPSAPMYNPDIRLFDFNLEKAARLLDEAGWLRDENDGWRYQDVEANGQRLPTKFAFSLMVPREAAASATVAAILKDDLAKIGVDMDIRSIEWATFQELRRKHEFQAQIAAWTAGKDPDDERNLWHSSAYADGRNYGGYRNPRVDELYEQARRCLDEPQRMRYYAEISKIIYDDAPYAFLVDTPILWAFDKQLRGVQYSPRGPCHFYPGVRNWWISK